MTCPLVLQGEARRSPLTEPNVYFADPIAARRLHWRASLWFYPSNDIDGNEMVFHARSSSVVYLIGVRTDHQIVLQVKLQCKWSVGTKDAITSMSGICTLRWGPQHRNVRRSAWSIHDPKREQAQPRIHPASPIVRFGSHNMNNNWSREGLTNSAYVGSQRRHRPLSCIAMGRSQRLWRVAKLRNVWHDAWTCHSEIKSGTCEPCSTRNLEREEGKCSKRLPHSQYALLEMLVICAAVSRICFRSN